MERLEGTWHVRSWTEAGGQTTLYIVVERGTMTISRFGDADWRLEIDERGENHTPQPAIKCGGRATLTSKIEAQPGAARNAEIFWTGDLTSINRSATGEGFIWRALCGWTVIGGRYPFAVRVEGDPAQPAILMEMANRYGTLVWQR